MVSAEQMMRYAMSHGFQKDAQRRDGRSSNEKSEAHYYNVANDKQSVQTY